ncbi:MAG: hypothetical protein HFH92_10810 [Lachnospiraceae bacterium]|nr:hypothetical protein [Lachnospiraceae bacterium]
MGREGMFFGRRERTWREDNRLSEVQTAIQALYQKGIRKSGELAQRSSGKQHDMWPIDSGRI